MTAERIVLGVESSCDETACALVADGRRVLASEVASQVEEHARFGGVVPEIASRQHLAALVPLLDKTFSVAGLTPREVGVVAVTRAPGLIGPLLVGLSAAKALAYALRVPLVGVNHLAAHLLAARLLEPAPAYPFLGLIVSGGHSALYRVDGPASFSLLGNTRDDAAGEAYDKVAKLLGLGYPGGLVIDRLAAAGDGRAMAFPRAMTRRDTLDFSFSGIKTALRNYVEASPEEARRRLADVCASFQEAVVDSLLIKTFQAAAQSGLKRLVLAGGVAANSRLRQRMRETAEARGVELFLPPLSLCTDNAAMVAVAGYELWQAGRRDGLDLNAAASETVF